MTLRGQEAQREAWIAAMDGPRLHHGWLLTGPRGVGKATFAHWAGRRLLGAADDQSQGARLIAARAHPDFKLVEREVWDKSSPPRIVPYDQRKDGDQPARSIRIAQIRMLEPILALSPSLGERRVVIIDAADDLERSAANALLKMLEEPPAGTVFLLISHASGRLLPTIRSRCRVLRFAPLADDVMAAVLEEALPEVEAKERAALLAAAHGSPGEALRLAGSDLARTEDILTRIAESGDPDNAERSALSKALGVKAATARYETFLQRAPAFIAGQARRRSGEDLARAIEQWARAQRLAAVALPQSLPPEAVVFELCGMVAALARKGTRAKA